MIKIGLLLFCLISCILAQNSTTPALITVTGTGEVNVPATDAVINVGITNRNMSVQVVRTEIDQIASNIIAYLQEEQIANIDIQTSYLSIQPYFSWNSDGSQNITPDYYIGSKGITFKLRDLSNYDNVMSGLYDLGLNQVNSVTFEADGQDDVNNLQAKTLAVQNAKNTAAAMTAQLGVGLGEVYSISDVTYSPPVPIFQPMAMAADSAVAGGAAGVASSGPSISPGSISYSTTVTVVFQIAQ